MGLHDQSTSYVHFLLLKLTGINFQKDLVDKITLVVLFLSLVISIYLNIQDYKRKEIKNPRKAGDNN
jgi:Na+-transporting NADH:ubiquinone oxidoreductase subunit NqrC